MKRKPEARGRENMAVETHDRETQTQEEWMRNHFGSPTAPEAIPEGDAVAQIMIEWEEK